MESIGAFFSIAFINPITNLLILFYKLLFIVGFPYALGFAIILLTILIRFILYPFISAQIKSAKKMQVIAPHMANIRVQHKEDKKRQQEELMKLYKEHNINPASGCLPLVIQIPVIWSLYHVLTVVVSASTNQAINDINKVLYSPFLKIQPGWDTTFFGFALSTTPSKLLASAPYLLAVPVITGILQFILSKMMLPENSPAKDPKKEDDFSAAFQKQSLFIFPVMIGFFSYSLPLGLSLYWNTFTVFGILQQYLLVGSGAAKPWFKKIGLNK